MAINRQDWLRSVVPAGTVIDFAGTIAPSGWLLCFGQAISRTDYAALFAALGETYGIGDGITTFNLPDYRGRVLVGKDDMGGVAASRMTTAGAGINGASLGAAGGAQVHSIVTAEVGSHTHTTVADTHFHDTGAYDNFSPVTGSMTGSSGQRGQYLAAVTSTAAIKTASDSHSHTVNSNAASTPHQNTQPSIVANKIIKV